MGIYMFKTQTLIDLLDDNDFDDFGAQVIPHALSKYNIFGNCSGG
jgi:ADP-glucose pyrophosphorylase